MHSTVPSSSSQKHSARSGFRTSSDSSSVERSSSKDSGHTGTTKSADTSRTSKRKSSADKRRTHSEDTSNVAQSDLHLHEEKRTTNECGPTQVISSSTHGYSSRAKDSWKRRGIRLDTAPVKRSQRKNEELISNGVDQLDRDHPNFDSLRRAYEANAARIRELETNIEELGGTFQERRKM